MPVKNMYLKDFPQISITNSDLRVPANDTRFDTHNTRIGSRYDSHSRYQDSRRNGNFISSTYHDTKNNEHKNRGRLNWNNDGFHKRNNVAENETIHSIPKKRTVIHYSLAKNSIVELNTCTNAWIPSCRGPNPIESNEKDIEEILKKVRSILNKITPDTMVVLTKSILDLQITTYKSLGKIIDMLFQKAIDEPNFTPQYAYICSQMKHLEVISEDHVTKTSFKQLILRKCQQTFKLVSDTEKNATESLQQIECCKDETLKTELQCEYDENERKQRKRSVGNCRFMCELFKVKLLNSNILEMCVRHLLKFPKEEPLECLCNILKHIGKYLNLENTFEKLQEFSSSNYKTKIPSRIRFMILDTIDLKNNNWIPRNAEIKPKTLSEIDKEFNVSSTKNLKISSVTEQLSNSYLNSNTKKVSTKASNVQVKNKSYSDILQNKTTENINSNSEKKEIEQILPANNAVELNTCKNAWVPRIRNSQKPTTIIKENIEEIEKRAQIYPTPDTLINKTTSDKPLIIQINEAGSSTKGSEIELDTCKNPWVPRFRNSHKLTETNIVENQITEKKDQKSPKPDTSIDLMKNIEQKTTVKKQKTLINAEKIIKMNPDKKKIQSDSLTKSSENELNTCQIPMVSRFRNSQMSTETKSVEIKKTEIVMNAEKIVKSNPERKKNQPDSLTKSSENELNTCQIPKVSRFRNSQKSAETKSVEIKKTESVMNAEKIVKSNPERKKNQPDSLTKSSENELNTCQIPKVSRFRNSQKSAETKSVEIKKTESVMNAEKIVKSNPERKKNQPDSLTKSSENELNTCKNLRVPSFRNLVQSTVASEVKIKKNVKKVKKPSEPGTPLKITNETQQQECCETFSSIIFSVTQENMVMSINKLTPRISSNDLIEETIDVLFERATTEPNCISLLVEMCTFLKKIFVNAKDGSKPVSFKKQLAIRCQKLLRMEKFERSLENKTPVISKETYAMIGELYNKKLLSINILLEYITDIPNRLTDDESIENICYFLTIIGAEIERPYSLKPTIKLLEAFVNNDVDSISPKLKGIITELIKLRNDKWCPVKKIDPPPLIIETQQNYSQSKVENPRTTPEGIDEDDETRTRRPQYFSEMIAESYSNIKLKCADFSKRIIEFDYQGCFWNFMNYCQSFIW